MRFLRRGCGGVFFTRRHEDTKGACRPSALRGTGSFRAKTPRHEGSPPRPIGRAVGNRRRMNSLPLCGFAALREIQRAWRAPVVCGCPRWAREGFFSRAETRRRPSRRSRPPTPASRHGGRKERLRHNRHLSASPRLRVNIPLACAGSGGGNGIFSREDAKTRRPCRSVGLSGIDGA